MPSQGLLEEAKGVLQVKAPDVRAPKKVDIRFFSRTIPPQSELFGLAPPLGARQPLDLHQHQRPDHYGQRPAATPRPSCARTFGCSPDQARTHTIPQPESSHVYSVEGSGQVLGSAHFT